MPLPIRPDIPLPRRALFVGIVALFALACQPGVGRPAVSLSLKRGAKTPADASVYIDEEYVAPLGYVAARGVRLPVGEHRITIVRDGYFPWDRLVEADRAPVALEVELVPIPD